jgi:hypothetical protein
MTRLTTPSFHHKPRHSQQFPISQILGLLLSLGISSNHEKKARQEATLSSTTQLLTEFLGEHLYLPCNSQKPSERDICIIILQLSFDWPNNLINTIKTVLSMPCTTPKHPEFKFELSAEASLHNLNILIRYH